MGVEFADEFASGVPYATAFAVQGTLGVGSAALNAWTFLLPQVLALVVEPYLLLRAEAWGRARALRLGLAGMAAALLCGAFAPSAAALGLCVALYFPSSGLACGVAQASLMDATDERAQSLTDWTLAGTLGDLATPLVLGLLDHAGCSWRWTFGLVGLAVVGVALLVPRFDAEDAAASRDHEGTAACKDAAGREDAARQDANEEGAPDNDADFEPPLREALRLIRGNRTLWWWLLASALCSLLDELFASQIGVHLASTMGEANATGPLTRQLVVLGVGGAAGLLVQRWALRRVAATRILTATCLATLVVYGAWLVALPDASSLFYTALLGACIATHYPLAQAQAYDALPGRAGVVAAASQAFTAIDLLYPVLVGYLSDTLSPAVGLCALLVQPLGLLGAAAYTRAARVKPSAAPNSRRSPT